MPSLASVVESSSQTADQHLNVSLSGADFSLAVLASGLSLTLVFSLVLSFFLLSFSVSV